MQAVKQEVCDDALLRTQILLRYVMLCMVFTQFALYTRILKAAATKDDQPLLEQALAGDHGPVEQDAIDDALVRAAENGHLYCTERLIKAGADPDSVDMDGDTPLMHAAVNGYLGV